ncbi:MAG: NlpC/P60 family protein [Armatimonadota bacterium]
MNKSVLVAALSVALISQGLADPDRGSAKAKATVIGANVNVRSKPSSDASLVQKVSGASGIILAQSGDWYKVRFMYGTVGWVRQDFLKISGKSAAKMIPIKLDSSPVLASKSSSSEGLTRYASLVNRTVNIHRGPSASNSVAGKVRGGKALVTDHRGDWFEVKFQYGTKGWVKSDAIVFPSNFDFKNSKTKAIIQSKAETVVATKTTPKPKAQISNILPDNTVENASTGERVGVPSESTDAESHETRSNAVMATVIGDGIAVRKGPSKTNSAFTKVNGGRATIIDHRGDFYQLRFEHGTIGWVHANYVSFPGHIVAEAPPIPIASSNPETAGRVISRAREFNGVRYSYGSSSRGATDCSGFTLQVFKSMGINLPRTAAQQCKVGTRVKRSQLQTGDLVFFNTRGYVSHVGIYIGNDRFIHASSGKGHVTESSLNEAYYGNRFLFGSRLLSASKVKKLELPSPGEIPAEKAEDRDDNKVEISRSGTANRRD